MLGLFFFGALVYKVFKQGFLLLGNTQDRMYRGMATGLIAGTVGLLFHALGANTFIIVRVMEPFWLIVGMVVFANKLEDDAAAAAAKAAAAEETIEQAEASGVETAKTIESA